MVQTPKTHAAVTKALGLDPKQDAEELGQWLHTLLMSNLTTSEFKTVMLLKGDLNAFIKNNHDVLGNSFKVNEAGQTVLVLNKLALSDKMRNKKPEFAQLSDLFFSLFACFAGLIDMAYSRSTGELFETGIKQLFGVGKTGEILHDSSGDGISEPDDLAKQRANFDDGASPALDATP